MNGILTLMPAKFSPCLAIVSFGRMQTNNSLKSPVDQ